jgi:hypothetical protein
MKVTVDLSPYEIMKLGRLTESDFGECWSPLIHTRDTIAFAIHQLIEDVETECDGECCFCCN